MLQVELHEASPRLGRVMGIGQDPGSDIIENMEPVDNAVSVSDTMEMDKKGKDKTKNTIELAGKPWPVSSNSHVITPNIIIPFVCSFFTVLIFNSC